jgi:peptidoglycan/LPS O-acetylase OafA/YrhL
VRNRYFDMLRALAIIRVVVYHATGWTALTIVFPAMGTMFALSGSLMAASLDRYGSATAMLRRCRRLLPPLWATAMIAVPAMLLTGLVPTWRLVWWVLPLVDPPTNAWGGTVLGAVWYLREYLWFVLISPVALWCFRRRPALVLLPFATLVGIQFGMPTIPMLRDFGIYFGCWLLGFAYHDGMLHRMRRWALVCAATVTATAGCAWFLTHPGPRGLDLNDIAIGDTLWSTGFVLLLFGLAPVRVAWLDRMRLASRVVSVLNGRAVTVYLWHQGVIVGLAMAGGLVGWDLTRVGGPVVWLSLVAAGVVGVTIVVGWVEDLSALRRPTLLPAGA